MRNHPEYKKIQKKYRIVQYTLVPLLTLSLSFVAIAISLIDKLPYLLPVSVSVLIVVVLLFYFSLKRIVAKENALRESIYGKEAELQATNPLFQAIIDEYELKGLELFINSIRPPVWKLEECFDCNGIITIIFTRKSSEIIIDLSDSEITMHFDEEMDDVIVTRALTSEEFRDMKALSEYIKLQCQTYYSTKKN